MLHNSKLVIYPSLNTEPPEISKCTTLYPLEPIGIGTSYCESLVSYIARLAYEHCVPPKTLIEKITERKYEGSFMLDKKNNLPEFIDKLEKLTQKSNLINLTLFKYFTLILSPSLYCNLLKWCPLCFEEWKKNKKELYFPIIWLISPVKICSIHNYPLQQKCQCGSRVSLSFKSFKIGYCPCCNNWLGSEQKYQITIEEKLNVDNLTQQYIVESVRGLIEEISTLNESVPLSRVNIVLNAYIFLHYQKFGTYNQRKDLAKLMNISIFTLTHHLAYPRYSHLIIFLKMAYYFKLSLKEFLLEDFKTLVSKLKS